MLTNLLNFSLANGIFEGLETWIRENGRGAESTVNIVIGLVAVVVLGILVAKAIWAARDGGVKEAAGYIWAIFFVVVVAMLGIVGFSTLVKKLAPLEDYVPDPNDTYFDTGAMMLSNYISNLFQ